MPLRRHAAAKPPPVRFTQAVAEEWQRLMAARAERGARERDTKLVAWVERMIPAIERHIEAARRLGVEPSEEMLKRLAWLKSQTKS